MNPFIDIAKVQRNIDSLYDLQLTLRKQRKFMRPIRTDLDYSRGWLWATLLLKTYTIIM